MLDITHKWNIKDWSGEKNQLPITDFKLFKIFEYMKKDQISKK